MLDQLTMDDFASHKDSTFRITLAPDAELELNLVLYEVQALADLRRQVAGDAVPGSPAFSLLFHGPQTPILPQRIYPLDHPELGRLEIFVVPLGPDAKGMRYQAIFY